MPLKDATPTVLATRAYPQKASNKLLRSAETNELYDLLLLVETRSLYPLAVLRSITMTSLTFGQYLTIVVLGTISSTLSLGGSSYIIYSGRKKAFKKDNVHYRLLLFLSFYDIVVSASVLLMPWLSPTPTNVEGEYDESKTNYPFGMGNAVTCTILGAMVVTGAFMVAFYNCYISINFLLMIKYQWARNNASRMRHLEILGHALAHIVGFSFMIACVVTDSINVRPFEHSCSVSGGNSATVLEWYSLSILFPITGIGVTATYLTYQYCRKTLQRNSEYMFDASLEDRQREKIRDIGSQAVLYTIVYLNSATWPGLGAVVTMVTPNIERRVSEPGYFTLLVLIHLLYPLQGFGNCFVYNRFHVTIMRWIGKKYHCCCRCCCSFFLFSESTQQKQQQGEPDDMMMIDSEMAEGGTLSSGGFDANAKSDSAETNKGIISLDENSGAGEQQQ